MAEEEKNDPIENGQSEEAPVEETPAGQAPPEEPSADETPAEEAAVEAAPAKETPPEKAKGESEPVEELGPEERRKRARSTKRRRPRPQLTPEQRAEARLALRKKKAIARREQRLKLRESKRARGPLEGTPPVEREAGSKRVRQGVVVSSKADKTITVTIQKQQSHPVYGKVVRYSTKLHAHDESNEANAGDTVRVVESRPLSRTKRWRLVEIVERAK